ncbi:hypothetical protein MCERE10_03301 [Burkholderiaceae bacterium]
MRLREFTDADEQLGLLRRIIDSTWTAIADEAAEQKEQERQERLKASKKPRSKRTKTASSPRSAPPAPRMPPKPKNTATAANMAVSNKTPAPAQQSVPVPAQSQVRPPMPNASPVAQLPSAAKTKLMPQQPVRPYTGMALRKQWGVG